MNSNTAGKGGRHIAPALLPADMAALGGLGASAHSRNDPHFGGSTHDLALKPHPGIPIFLNKLYNMVCDRASNDLIRWADDGHSFVVYRHEDFARDVLPRFFKHNNFSSFVRQLNMYGFHKVPHPMQGVLISEEPESWEFTNIHFQRGLPDLLLLVKRKSSRLTGTVSNSANAGGTSAPSSITSLSASSSAPSISNRSASQAAPSTASYTPGSIQPGQPLTRNPTAVTAGGPSQPQPSPLSAPLSDHRGATSLAVIIAELAALRQTQQTIAEEIRRMQQDNQILWQESLAQRDRHQKQQDTIDKILRFLASVFSSDRVKNLAEPSKSHTAKQPFHQLNSVPKKKRRLLLENGASSDSSADDLTQLPLTASGGDAHIYSLGDSAPVLDVGLSQKLLEALQPARDVSEVNASPSPATGMHGATSADRTNNRQLYPLFGDEFDYSAELPHPTPIHAASTASASPLQSPVPHTDPTEVLASNLEDVDHNLTSVAESLGLTDEDLANLDGMDVDDFLQNYFQSRTLDDGGASYVPPATQPPENTHIGADRQPQQNDNMPGSAS